MPNYKWKCPRCTMSFEERKHIPECYKGFCATPGCRLLFGGGSEGNGGTKQHPCYTTKEEARHKLVAADWMPDRSMAT